MGPGDDRVEDRLDLSAHLCELVLDPHWCSCQHLAFENPGSLEFPISADAAP